MYDIQFQSDDRSASETCGRMSRYWDAGTSVDVLTTMRTDDKTNKSTDRFPKIDEILDRVSRQTKLGHA